MRATESMTASENRCRNCPAKATDLHHLLPRSIHPRGKTEPQNQIPLCHDCHMCWHDRVITLWRQILTMEEWNYIATHGDFTWLARWYPDRDNDLPF